jgi:hypothetical protein
MKFAAILALAASASAFVPVSQTVRSSVAVQETKVWFLSVILMLSIFVIVIHLSQTYF